MAGFVACYRGLMVFLMIHALKPEPRIMRYELSDYGWTAIKPMLPNKPRGIRCANNRHLLNGILGSGLWCAMARPMLREPPMTTASFGGGRLTSGTGAWMRLLPVTTRAYKRDSRGRRHPMACQSITSSRPVRRTTTGGVRLSPHRLASTNDVTRGSLL
jgi:transposase